MTSSSPAITADALTKTYPGGRGRPPVNALRGLDLDLAAGAVTGLLGPNGAGKSTTTKILTTLSRPTSGTARVHGHDVTREPAAVRRLIGYVSQGTGTDPLLTAEENLVLAARLRGLSHADARERARRLLDEFGLAEHRARPVAKFSGGLRRRLDVAAALTHRPSVLFLDEPTTGLDPESRAAMWAEIRRLRTEDALTVVLTTHYLEEADRLADRLVLIDRGVEVVSGTSPELKAALRGETLRVALVEPDDGLVRRTAATVAGLRDVVVEVRGTAGELTARVADAAAALPAVLGALEAAGVAFGAASVSAPTLDDVYLHHVGHSFDATASAVSDSEGAAA
ncbi:ABC transporter ATP-binding protein [Agromyces sp. MMS24-K17]|uniref:ABC transporter ATP-binding protein n=1 Tax=Agromyces sp. MMS24-K17 TaxID=3372850 RepID=UPI0037543A33